MCGGFVVPLRRMGPQLAYHLGRIATYTGLGAFMGYAGSFVQGAGRIAGIQGLATALAGALMLAWAAARWRGRTLFEATAVSPLRLPALRRAAGSITRRPTGPGALLLGLLLGFLPCGLVGTMEIRAAGAGSPAGGMLTMFLFGLGTVPGLVGFAALSRAIGGRLRRRLDRAAALLVAAGGVLALLRGLAENGLVPHVSPWLW